LPTFTALSADFEVLPPVGPKEEEVTAAVVGYGAEGEILTDAALRIPGVRFKAVFDIWPSQCQKAKGRLLQIGHQRRSNPRYIHAIENVIRNTLDPLCENAITLKKFETTRLCL